MEARELSLALFDLDGTLIDGDHDVLWARFLARAGLVDAAPIERFKRDYDAGRLDVDAFFAWQLAPLGALEPARLEELRARFFELEIRPRLRPWTRALTDEHARRGHTLVLITASNRFLAEPTARALGFEHLLASEPERRDGRFTGNLAPPPCFREGKLAHLARWLEQRGARAAASWAYSDSANDLPLLEWADHATVVTPTPELSALAAARGWRRIEAPPAQPGSDAVRIDGD